MIDSGLVTESLCGACGLCCNGAIFRDVKLQPGDKVEELRSCGLPLRRARSRAEQVGGNDAGKVFRFRQPCAAFDGCRCRIYDVRPRHCRDFECALFISVKAGRISIGQALRVIRLARRRLGRVLKLLRALGDTEEQLSLARRFHHVSRRLEAGDLAPQTAGLYGELTLAMHQLNRLLSESFYPGSGSAED